MLCYTGLTSAFGTITVPRRRGIGPMQLRRKRAHPCCSRGQQTGTGWPSKPGTHQASSARESKPGPAHPHRDEVKMQDAASTRDGKQARKQSMMTRMQRKFGGHWAAWVTRPHLPLRLASGTTTSRGCWHNPLPLCLPMRALATLKPCPQTTQPSMSARDSDCPEGGR
jgi:hypothetical protein